MKEKIYTSNGNILYLYQVMKQYTDSQHPLKVKEIEELILKEYGEEVSSRTIRRNFKVLTEKFHLVIENIGDSYYMDYEDNDFESFEIRCLVDMVNYSNFVDENLTKDLTQKLINQLNKHDKETLEDYEAYMKSTKTSNKEVFYTIQILAEAIKNKQNIKFDYYKYNTKKEYVFRKAFHIFPVTIVCEIGQYYLIAADATKELFHFRLDRMKNVQIVEGKTVTISKKQLNSYMDSTVGVFGGEKQTIKAIVQNHAIDDVIDHFGKEVRVTPKDKEHFVMETEVNQEGFKYWALRNLQLVEVLEPKALRKEMLEIVQEASKKYEK